MKGTRDIRPNPISIPLRICDSCFWRLFRFLRTSLCVLLNLVCSPIVISCKTLYKTSKGFLGLSRYRWGNYIAVFCLAVSPRENLSQRISAGSRGGAGGSQHQGPVETEWRTIRRAPREGALFMEDNFSTNRGWGMVWGWFKHIIFIVYLISIIITSAPPQIIRR